MEYEVFIPFFVAGLASFLLLPPIKKERITCGCKCYTGCGWKSILGSTLTFFCLTFCFFFLILDSVFRFYNMVVQDPFDETRVYLVCLAAGAILALWAVSCGGNTIWSIAVWTVMVSLAVNTYFPCEDKLCFLLRSFLSVLVSAIASSIISALVYRCE